MATVSEGLPPPLHGIPTSKEKKYDRQLRLWAASGQAALEDAHLLLINSGPGVTGVETLKNLVLPGIGQFTIQDSALVTEADLGVNFFLDDSALNTPRAETTSRLLQELNPDVRGYAITEPIDSWISKPDSLRPYTLILVSSPVKSEVLATIASHAEQHAIPMFYYHSVGFYSHFSVQLSPAFPIVDTHPDPTSTTDLRLLRPWPALTKFMKEKTANLGTLSAHDVGHIPYVLLLLHFLSEWRSTHAGEPPASYKEKSEFREMVRSAGPPDEENFHEGAAAVLKSLNPPTAPSSLLAVLDAPEAQSLTATSPSFWYMANAVHIFYTEHGDQLPLPGALPDMKAKSADYIALQNIYKTKARDDCAEVVDTVRWLEKQHGRPADQQIDVKEIELFCKGAAHIKLVRGRSAPLRLARDCMAWDSESAKTATQALAMGAADSGILLYIAFLAYDSFLATHVAGGDLSGTPKPPGLYDADVDEDGGKVIESACAILDAIIKAAGAFLENPEYDEAKESLSNICSELVRAGGAELHNIAALTGGLLAQEVIKAITKQYVPIDNTCIFDGVNSKTAVLRL